LKKNYCYSNNYLKMNYWRFLSFTKKYREIYSSDSEKSSMNTICLNSLGKEGDYDWVIELEEVDVHYDEKTANIKKIVISTGLLETSSCKNIFVKQCSITVTLKNGTEKFIDTHTVNRTIKRSMEEWSLLNEFEVNINTDFKNVVIHLAVVFRGTDELVLERCSLETLSRCFLELFEAQQNCDLRFCVNDELIGAHSLVLTARVPYFAKMMVSGMKESQTKEINIEDADAETIRGLLQFVYSGKAPNNLDDKAELLLPLADQYDIQELKHLCCKALANKANSNNICSILILAHTFNCSTLKFLCFHMLKLWLYGFNTSNLAILHAAPYLMSEFILFIHNENVEKVKLVEFNLD